ncbi:sigma-54-dependent Fis family transcriptional regulator [Dehalobacter sp. DCM]|uniref:sigma-54-dependent Fis family transcriptional regulator n=1 Tax=Dehalobacter sp. DCM TaxID=2907827 RepID=UPI003FCCF922
MREKVTEIKKRFLENDEDPRVSPYVPLEIAESWIRSKNNHVDPYTNHLGYMLSPEEQEILAESKKDLIEIAVPFMKKYLSLLSVSGYTLLLTDEKGTLLYVEGEGRNEPHLKFGSVVSEEYAGTNAHSLCVRLGQAVQFIGPYNYSVTLNENIVSAAPIFDENHHIIGALTIYQLIPENDISNMQTHSLGWVISMAYAIEQQLILKKSNNHLILSNGTLEATLSFVSGGLITLNKQGYISHINQEGNTILSLGFASLNDEHYSQYIKDTRPIKDALENGIPAHNHEVIIIKDHLEKRYLMTVNPVLDENNIPNGAVIHLSPIEGIKKLVNDLRGAQATYGFENLVGKSPIFLETIATAKQFSKMYANVLIQGESGTGKELFAQAIHKDFRPEGPFISINCSAMPRNLIESELFGYEGGAFTGAERKGRPGLIELANEGTLFLDEIGDMPLEIQPVLLRVLEDKKVLRIGGQKYIPVDFRVIAATNKDLKTMVMEKAFREDLYYRLAVFKLKIPSLRKKKDDILELANFFIQGTCKRVGRKEIPSLSSPVKEKLIEYNWPGNVRQLENAMVYAVTMAQSKLINLKDLPDDILYPEIISNQPSNAVSLEDAEKNAIKNAIIQTDYNVADAAEILGIAKSTLYNKLKQYNIPL